MAWELLKDPAYRRYWIFLFLSQIGTWMQATALGWVVLELTGQAERLGLVLALLFAPSLLFTMPAGALADRLPRARLLLVFQGGMAILALWMGLLIARGTAGFGHLVVFALLYGTMGAFEVPTRQAFNVELAGKSRIAGAIGLNSFSFNVSRLAAPAVAGLIIAKWGTAVAFLINGLSFFPMLVFLARYPSQPPAVQKESFLLALRQGLAYVKRTPVMRWTLLLVFLVATFAMNFQALIPAYARLVLGLGAEGYGLLMSAMGVGALFGALLTVISSRVRPRWILFGSFVLAIAQILLALPVGTLGAAILFAFSGFSMVVTLISANSTVQALVPDLLRGRVVALYSLVLMGSGPPGMYLTGLAFDAFGRYATLAMGLVALLAALGHALLPWPKRVTPV